MESDKISIKSLQSLSSEEVEEAKQLSAVELGFKVKEIRRKRAHLNQGELAYLIGTVQSAVSEIESGIYPITMDLISRLATALNANPLELAAAYWGIEEAEFGNPEMEFIGGILQLVEQYNKSKQNPRLPLLPQRRTDPGPEYAAGKETAMKEHRVRSKQQKRPSQKEKSSENHNDGQISD